MCIRDRTFLAAYPSATFQSPLPDIENAAPSTDDARLAVVTGWLMHSGPVTASRLAETLRLPASAVEQALLRLEAAGLVLRGKFEKPESGETEWCERRLLARIHRLTLGRLRKQIEPVTAAQFMRWLMRWQHLAPGTQVLGERGTLEVLRQLQGFEIPANAWERQILAPRVAGYDPEVLDRLCLTGAVGWGRLSPHPATLEDRGGARRVVPTSVAPITFFVRDSSEWMLPRNAAPENPGPPTRTGFVRVGVQNPGPPTPGSPTRPGFGRGGVGARTGFVRVGAQNSREADRELRGLSHVARDVFAFLRNRGASFFADIVRGTGKLKAEVETGLWELVAAGLVTADGFDNLRALINPRRRSGQGSGRAARPRHAAGRWSLLYGGEPVERTQAVEAACRMLLERYGVVFRELLARESIVPKWRELLNGFRRLEDRGDIRGGRFVSGFLGEQFALPVAVDSLRALRREAPGAPARASVAGSPASLGVGFAGLSFARDGVAEPPADDTITVSAADPLNLVGIVVPGDRVPAISGYTVTFRNGVAVAPVEQSQAVAISR